MGAGLALSLALAITLGARARRHLRPTLVCGGVLCGLASAVVAVVGVALGRADAGASAAGLSILIPMAACGLSTARGRWRTGVVAFTSLAMGVAAVALLATWEASAIGGLIVGALVGVWLAWRADQPAVNAGSEQWISSSVAALVLGIAALSFRHVHGSPSHTRRCHEHAPGDAARSLAGDPDHGRRLSPSREAAWRDRPWSCPRMSGCGTCRSIRTRTISSCRWLCSRASQVWWGWWDVRGRWLGPHCRCAVARPASTATPVLHGGSGRRARDARLRRTVRVGPLRERSPVLHAAALWSHLRPRTRRAEQRTPWPSRRNDVSRCSSALLRSRSSSR